MWIANILSRFQEMYIAGVFVFIRHEFYKLWLNDSGFYLFFLHFLKLSSIVCVWKAAKMHFYALKMAGKMMKIEAVFFFLLCTRNYNWTYMYINACMSVHTMKAKSLQPPSNWLFLQQTFHSYQQKQTVEEYWCGVHSRKEQPTAVKVLLCGKQSENIQNTWYKYESPTIVSIENYIQDISN